VTGVVSPQLRHPQWCVGRACTVQATHIEGLHNGWHVGATASVDCFGPDQVRWDLSLAAFYDELDSTPEGEPQVRLTQVATAFEDVQLSSYVTAAQARALAAALVAIADAADALLIPAESSLSS
jgi:hypothetical protein